MCTFDIIPDRQEVVFHCRDHEGDYDLPLPFSTFLQIGVAMCLQRQINQGECPDDWSQVWLAARTELFTRNLI